MALEEKNKKKFSILVPAFIASTLALILSVISIILYASNCASEFNANTVSPNVIGLSIAGIIFAFLAFCGGFAGLLLKKSEKVSYIVMLSRIFNYAAFILLLGSFMFQILDEYQLLGTIFYAMLNAGHGDPVDPVLAGSYWASLIMSLVACILSLVAGILVRIKSHKVIPEIKVEKEEPAHE